MTVAMLIDNPHGSREIYERILERLGAEVPLGGIVHLAGPSPSGGWRVIEVWRTEDEGRRFLAEKFAPAFRAAGAPGAPPPPQFWPLEALELGQRTDGRAASGPRAGAL